VSDPPTIEAFPEESDTDVELARALTHAHLRGLLEALVFASEKPMKSVELARLASAPVTEVREVMAELKATYTNRGVVLDEIAGGWLFRTGAQYAPFVRELSRERPVRLTRAQALHLALMSSENHAAQLLGRTYPGGVEAAVAAMNAKARELGMNDSHFADPTGLLPENRATPNDLVRMVKAAYSYPEIREFSVSTEYDLRMGKHSVRFLNTNRLTSHADWQIGLQKTGYINAAGRCLVMQAVIEGRRIVMVLLDSMGRYSRFADAQRIHDWLIARGSAGKTALE